MFMINEFHYIEAKKMSDEEDDDTFVTIGTPFQPLEEDEGGEERKLVYARQRKPGETYRERKERQRFHGAFTGGFSAGYFNTVGSKEGACWCALQLAHRSCAWRRILAAFLHCSEAAFAATACLMAGLLSSAGLKLTCRLAGALPRMDPRLILLLPAAQGGANGPAARGLHGR